MNFTLRRSGFKMQPTIVRDGHDIATHVFGDLEVAKTLVHNVSTQEAIQTATNAWVNSLSIDGPDNAGLVPGTGLWTVRDTANRGQFVGIRGVFIAPALPENTVATFVAVARSYWGQGVSSDSSALLCAHAFQASAIDAIYTRVWPLLNPRSDAVQRRMGFVPAERHTLRDTFGEKRMAEILAFELWRASNLVAELPSDDLRGIAIKIGQLSAEGLLEKGSAIERINAALPSQLAVQPNIQNQIVEDVTAGFENPAWASYRLSRENWMSRMDQS